MSRPQRIIGDLQAPRSRRFPHAQIDRSIHLTADVLESGLGLDLTFASTESADNDMKGVFGFADPQCHFPQVEEPRQFVEAHLRVGVFEDTGAGIRFE